MQPVIWSTDESPGAPALHRWRAMVDQSLFSLEIHSSADNFHARMEQAPLGRALLSKLVAGQQSVRRTPRAIARTRDRPKLDIIAVSEGVFRYRQNGHEDVLRAGDCVLLDRSAPYAFEASSSCSMTLAVEHDWLARWTPDPGALAGRRIDGARGWGQALSTILTMLEVDAIDRLTLPGGAIAEQIASLLVLAATPSEAPSHRDRRLDARLDDLIAENAHDPAFGAAQAAAGLGIALRTLHLRCAAHGASFGARLMAARLDRARAMLADPRCRDLAIGEIAWRTGFADQGHFAKRFRARFGVTPTSHRRAMHI